MHAESSSTPSPAISLTPTSYLVLGFVAWMQPATPYDLKQATYRSVGSFWAFPHTQLYTEPVRLAQAGLLSEEREQHGVAIARAQRETHARRLTEHLGQDRAQRERGAGTEARQRLPHSTARATALRQATLRFGLAYERAAVDFWCAIEVAPPERPQGRHPGMPTDGARTAP